VYVFGFPFGATLGPNITVSDSSISSLRKSPDGIVTQIQVNGGMNPGNSGGPLVDTRGVVVGVAVSIIRGTQINFAIPGDKLPGLLRGRVTRIQFGEPFVEGKRVKLPLELECLDPLERIRDLKIAVWSGKPGNAHPPSTKTPDLSPGDGPRQFFPLAYREGKAEVEIDLPPWDYSKVVWVQPVLTDGIQSAYWAEAFAYKPTAFAPLERKPANLRYRFDVQSERSVKMRSTLKLQAVRGPQQLSTAKTMEAEALETVHPDARGGAFRLKIGSSKSSTEENGQTKPTELQAEKLVRDQSLDFLTDPAGSLLGRGNSPTLDKSKPAALRGEFEDLVNRIANTYELTFVSVPGKELQPKETWITRLPLMVIKDGKKDVVDILAIGTFEGVRLHEGQQLALIALTGTLRERNGSVAAGRFSGKVHFSLDRGYVTLAEVKVEAEFSMGDTIAMQTLEVQLSRSAGNLLKNAP
jgi:hypothetical protein